MPDPLDTAYQIPCLHCGAMPVAGWQNGPEFLTCPTQNCENSYIEIVFECWPVSLTNKDKRRLSKELEE
jgi:hypothetical protein